MDVWLMTAAYLNCFISIDEKNICLHIKETRVRLQHLLASKSHSKEYFWATIQNVKCKEKLTWEKNSV